MKLIKIFFLLIFFCVTNASANDEIEFQKWKNEFKIVALANNISEKTFDTVNYECTKFLANVIKYDRYQPEFYEDTKTYISKRTSKNKVSKG
jgi:membrane-bound lytic murein transglycosylase B